MKNLSTQEFCDMFNACTKGREFAENYATMRECYEALLNGKAGEKSAAWAICVFSREGATSEKNQRLFSVSCARRVQHLMKDERSIRALDVAERYANGEATKAELKEAFAEAARAAWAAENEVGLAARAAYAAAVAAQESPWAAARAAYAAAVMVMEACGSDSESLLKILKTYGNIFEDEEVNAEVTQ